MKEAWKLVLTLGLIAAISGGGLGAFYHFTMPIVEARQMEEMIEKGFKEVLPIAVSFQAIEEGQGELPPGVTQVYEGLDENNNRIGIAYEAVGPGYGGDITLAVGVDPGTNSVIGIKVLSHEETPGMGDKIEGESFLSQFTGKPVDAPFVVGQDIDGITAATVSSEAVAKLVGGTAQQVLEYAGEV